jgi:uncharacterized membrane protein
VVRISFMRSMAFTRRTQRRTRIQERLRPYNHLLENRKGKSDGPLILCNNVRSQLNPYSAWRPLKPKTRMERMAIGKLRRAHDTVQGAGILPTIIGGVVGVVAGVVVAAAGFPHVTFVICLALGAAAGFTYYLRAPKRMADALDVIGDKLRRD